MTIKEYKELEKRLEKKRAKINKKLLKAARKLVVKCETNYSYGKGCGEVSEIGDCDYIQTHWYEEPYSCTGGDNWYTGEGNFICPKCGHRNRLHNRERHQDFRYAFKSVTDEYED